MRKNLIKDKIFEELESADKDFEFHKLFEIIFHLKTCNSCSQLYKYCLENAKKHLNQQYL
jgi:Pyruvate/2-oxoacid:ferredoxin oxidoreductase delta subunit